MTTASRIAIWSVILTVPGLAQECRSLSGTWRMNRAKSFFAGTKNPAQQAESETLVIAQNGPRIQESWTFEGTVIRGRVTFAYVADGTEQKIGRGENGQSPVSVRAEWQNCTLIVDKKMIILGALLVDVRNTYVLSEQGAQLTILQEWHTTFADSERRLVFERSEKDK